jgi:hypothetical protein
LNFRLLRFSAVQLVFAHWSFRFHEMGDFKPSVGQCFGSGFGVRGFLTGSYLEFA